MYCELCCFVSVCQIVMFDVFRFSSISDLFRGSCKVLGQFFNIRIL